MNPHQRDESTVLDLAAISRGQQQQQQQHQHSFSTTASATTPQHTARPPSVCDISKPHHHSRTNEKKECPRHAEGHEPNRFTTRELGSKRVVSLFYGSDILLFDSIMSWKKANPDKRVEDAVDAFDEHQGSDAMANIIYETQAFDMIFKYPIPAHLQKVSDTPPTLGMGPNLSDIEIDPQSPEAIARKEERLARQKEFEEQEKKRQEEQAKIQADLEAGIIDPQIEKDEKLEKQRLRFKKALLKESLIIEEEPNIEGEEMYLKVYTPFWRLCVEAQRLRYKVELAHFETKKEKEAAAKAMAKEKGRGVFHKYIGRFLQRADNVTLPLRPESLLFKATKLRQYALGEKTRKWSDIVRHGGGIKPDGSGVGIHQGSDGKDAFFSTGQRGNLTESIIIYCKIHTKRGDRHALKSAMEKNAISDMFTLHDGSYKSKVKPLPNLRTQLYHTWVRSARAQPLEEIRFYYGEKIALYFAWIGHYTKWLIPAAIAGLLFLIYGILYSFIWDSHKDTASIENKQTVIAIFDNALTLPFALFMSVWAALFVEFWKRKSNVLAYEWNTLDFERRERARPEFKPTGTRISPVTGKMELYYPRYKQVISFIISILVVLVAIVIVVVSVGSLMMFNAKAKPKERDEQGNLKSDYKMTVATAVMNLAVIMILGTVYARIAKLLTDLENHRRLTQYEDSLILKRFLFDFVNFYSALAYLAFFKDTIGPDVIGEQIFDDKNRYFALYELTIQLAIVFVGKQFINQVQELVIPQIHKWWNRKNELAEKAKLNSKYKDKKNMVKPPQWAKDDVLPTYNPQMFEEYRELIVQFGFCTLFVTAFPIAPIFALLNNIIEIRVDAYKLLTQHRRPVSQPTQDIGSWAKILALLTHISVLSNAALIAFRSEWMKENVFLKMVWVTNQSTHWTRNDNDGMDFALLAVRMLFIFVYEHAVFFIKIAIANLVTDTPQTVKLAIERESYYTRLALDDEEPAQDEVLEDLDDDSEESEDEDDLQRRLLFGRTPSDEKDGSKRISQQGGLQDLDGDGVIEGDGEGDEDEEEDEEALEAMIKAGGCGCAAHGDGVVGTAQGGFEGTWMSKFKTENAATLRKRQQRLRRRLTNKKKNEEKAK